MIISNIIIMNNNLNEEIRKNIDDEIKKQFDFFKNKFYKKK
mgnify:CR=1 FL=1|jgi:hypothetical protein